MKLRRDKTLQTAVMDADAAKKVNPLDLSSDQDLSIALMNLITIEHMYYDSKQAKNSVGAMVHDIRTRLMSRIVSEQHTDISFKLLGKSMELITDGMQAMESGKSVAAYTKFDDAYGLYSLFWGINMGLTSKDEINALDVEF